MVDYEIFEIILNIGGTIRFFCVKADRFLNVRLKHRDNTHTFFKY